jgi:hypothetical protein
MKGHYAMDERQTLVLDQLGQALKDVMPDEGHALPPGFRDLLSRLRAADYARDRTYTESRSS